MPVSDVDVEAIRAVLLRDGGQFDDNYTYDASRLAEIAELAGLRVVYLPCDGCGNKPLPDRVERGDGDSPVTAGARRAIEQREAVPGMPCEGPYPASSAEVADELAQFVAGLDAAEAPGVLDILAMKLAELQGM
jgi:hypothetical protein